MSSTRYEKRLHRGRRRNSDKKGPNRTDPRLSEIFAPSPRVACRMRHPPANAEQPKPKPKPNPAHRTNPKLKPFPSNQIRSNPIRPGPPRGRSEGSGSVFYLSYLAGHVAPLGSPPKALEHLLLYCIRIILQVFLSSCK